MAELTVNNGLTILVSSDKYDFGEVNPTDILDYEFPFHGSGDQIEYIEKGCGCTSAYYDAETNKIKGQLDIAKANGSKDYPEGETAINKHLFVWLNDGQPRFVADAKKQKQSNPKKSWFRLNLVGSVVV